MEIFSIEFLKSLGAVVVGGLVLGPLLMHAWPEHFDPHHDTKEASK